MWSCGANDNAALGRETTGVPDPKKGETLDEDYLTSNPFPIQSLVDEGFRAARVAAGDSIAAAISAKGELRVWGTFRVCPRNFLKKTETHGGDASRLWKASSVSLGAKSTNTNPSRW